MGNRVTQHIESYVENLTITDMIMDRVQCAIDDVSVDDILRDLIDDVDAETVIFQLVDIIGKDKFMDMIEDL